MKSYQIIAIIIAFLVLFWIGSGFIFSGSETDQEPKQAPQIQDALTQVRVRDIQSQDYIDDVIVTGRSQASKRVEIKAETNGLITSVLQEEGTRVESDTLLANLEVRDRKSRVQEAKERVNQRQIEYNAARRLANEGFNSKVRLAQSLADLENAKAVLKDAQSSLTKTTIKAPFDGIIAEQFVETGDYLAPGNPIFVLVNLNPVEFVGYISERRISDVKLEKETVIEFLDNSQIKGKVSYVAPAADPQTRTFRVIVSAPNDDLKLKEGLTAKLRIPSTKKSAYKISPSILSLDDAGVIGVKIVDERNIVRFIPVTILADKAEAMWVELSKMQTGVVRFITVGQEFVGINQKVEPVPAQGDGLL